MVPETKMKGVRGCLSRASFKARMPSNEGSV